MKNRHAFFAILVSLTVLMSGCATRQVSLTYSSTLTPPKAAGSPTVCVQGFADMRAEKSLGFVRNGFGAKMANVAAKPGEPLPSDWIAKALVAELGRAGCVVVSESNASRFVINGTIQNISVNSYMMMRGEISMNIRMTNGARIALDQLYQAKAEKVNWWSASSEFQQTLTMTLQDLMRQAVPDITAAMSKQHSNLPVAAVTDIKSPAVAPATSATEDPVQAEPVVKPAPTVPTETVSRAPLADIPTQLKKLQELKDLGLVTEEEFEAKRKELVDQL